MPTLSYMHLQARFARKDYMSEDALTTILADHNISTSNLSYHLKEDGKFFEYHMTLRTKRADNFQRLSNSLTKLEQLLEFAITPVG